MSKFDMFRRIASAYTGRNKAELVLGKSGPKDVQIKCLVVSVADYDGVIQKNDLIKVGNLIDLFYSICIRNAFHYEEDIEQFSGNRVIVLFDVYANKLKEEDNIIKCAIDIFEEFRRLSPAERLNSNIGVGICSGRAILGEYGTDYRRAVSFLGEPINCAIKLSEKIPRINICKTLSQTTIRHDAIQFLEHSISKGV